MLAASCAPAAAGVDADVLKQIRSLGEALWTGVVFAAVLVSAFAAIMMWFICGALGLLAEHSGDLAESFRHSIERSRAFVTMLPAVLRLRLSASVDLFRHSIERSRRLFSTLWSLFFGWVSLECACHMVQWSCLASLWVALYETASFAPAACLIGWALFRRCRDASQRYGAVFAVATFIVTVATYYITALPALVASSVGVPDVTNFEHFLGEDIGQYVGRFLAPCHAQNLQRELPVSIAARAGPVLALFVSMIALLNCSSQTDPVVTAKMRKRKRLGEGPACRSDIRAMLCAQVVVCDVMGLLTTNEPACKAAVTRTLQILVHHPLVLCALVGALDWFNKLSKFTAVEAVCCAVRIAVSFCRAAQRFGAEVVAMVARDFLKSYPVIADVLHVLAVVSAGSFLIGKCLWIAAYEMFETACPRMVNASCSSTLAAAPAAVITLVNATLKALGATPCTSFMSFGVKQAPDNRMQVFVAGFRSGTIAVDVRPSDDVKRLTEAILEREGVALSEQRLTYGQKDLQHGKSLAAYGIEKECTVHLRLRGRGGGNCLGCFQVVGRPVTEPLEFDNPMPIVIPGATSGVAAGGSVTPAPQAAAGAPELREPGQTGAAAGASSAPRAVEQAPSAVSPSPVVQEPDPPASGAAATASPATQVRVPTQQKERPDALKTAIVFGRLDDPALQERLRSPQPQKAIRVFLSSTFTDTAEERNCILKEVVPKLQAEFAKYGYEFQASEMRWSIGKEESNDMETSAICMAELTNCQASSAGLNYLYIACEKYGFRPPPKTIPQHVFEQLVAEKDAASVRECYSLDTNSSVTPDCFKPPLPACGPSQQTREEWDADSGPQYVLRIGTDPWDRFEKLVLTLRTAAQQLWRKEYSDGVHRNPVSSHWLKKFIISVTEEELCHGALWANPEDGRTRIKVFKRSFTAGEGKYNGIPLDDEKAKAFVDMKKDGKVDEEAQKLLAEQKAMRSPDREWIIDWAPGKGVDPTNRPDHKAYVREFCAQLEAPCIESLNEALAHEEKPDRVVDEAERHLRFADERDRKFDNKTAVDVLGRARKYLDAGNNGKVFVIWGKSGAGKTYVLAKTAAEAAARSKALNGVFVARFLGTTSASSKVALLLESILEQLKLAYDKGDVEIPSNFRELEALFKEAVTTWPSAEKPLTLVLDSVDQLDDTNQGRLLQWLPATTLPECVRIVASTLPDYEEMEGKSGFQCLSRLEGALHDEASFAMVQDIKDPESIVGHLLSLQGRTITAEQMTVVLDAFHKRSEEDMAGTPLWLTLVVHLAATWHSYDTAPTIPTSVRGLIINLFELTFTLCACSAISGVD